MSTSNIGYDLSSPYSLSSGSSVDSFESEVDGRSAIEQIDDFINDFSIGAFAERNDKKTNHEKMEKLSSRVTVLSEEEIDKLEHRIEKDEKEMLNAIKTNLSVADQQRRSETANLKFRKEIEISSFSTSENTEFKQFLLEDQSFEIAVCSTPGCCDYMEDVTMVTDIEFSAGKNNYKAILCAVLDGHSSDKKSGKGVALYVKDALPQYLKARLEQFNKEGLTVLGMGNALKLAFVDCQDNINKEIFSDGGCTVNLTLILADRIWFANIGDSRSIYLEPNAEASTAHLNSQFISENPYPINLVRQMTEDQKPEEKRFSNGILKRGGDITQRSNDTPRINGMLNMARSIGDLKCKRNGVRVLSARPKITYMEFKKGYIAQASDGLFCVASSNDVAYAVGYGIMKEKTMGEIVSNIVMCAVSSEVNSPDNVAMILIRVKPT